MSSELTCGNYKCPLDEETCEKAKNELREDPKKRQDDINKLRKWLEKQPHITGCRKDDQFLLRFLRTSKFDETRAAKMVDAFCRVRASPSQGVPDWFQNIDLKDPKMQEIMDLGAVLPLGRDSQKRMVVLNRTGAWDPTLHGFENVMKLSYIIMDALLRDEESQVHGFVIFLDFTEFGVKHVTCWGRSTISKAMKTWQDVYPTRNKGVSYYNYPALFNPLFEIFKYFMKEKTKSRLHFHGSSQDSLAEQIPKSILPEEYGGDRGPLQNVVDEWKTELLGMQEEFDLLNTLKIDDRKIPKTDDGSASVSSYDNTMGVEGSFRKLNVD